MFPSKTKNDNYGIFCQKVYDGLQSDEIEIPFLSCIKGKSFNKFYNAFRYFIFISDVLLKILFRSKKFDIIYFQYVWIHVFFASILFRFMHKRNKKIIINFHGEDLLNFVEHPYKKKFIKILNYADLIIFPSLYYQNWLKSKFVVDEKKLFVSASGGVDREVFNYKKCNKINRNICFCSRLVPHKGWKDFVDAISILKKHNFVINAVMIGYGPDMGALKDKIKDKKLEDIITVKTGLTHEDIAMEYSNSELFVFPTANITESLGLVAIEAMSCGLPVIGTKIAALPEYISDGENGFIVDVNAPMQLAEKIVHYFSLSDDEKNRISHNALETSKRYEFHTVCAELKEKILSLFNNITK